MDESCVPPRTAANENFRTRRHHAEGELPPLAAICEIEPCRHYTPHRRDDFNFFELVLKRPIAAPDKSTLARNANIPRPRTPSIIRPAVRYERHAPNQWHARPSAVKRGFSWR